MGSKWVVDGVSVGVADVLAAAVACAIFHVYRLIVFPSSSSLYALVIATVGVESLG